MIGQLLEATPHVGYLHRCFEKCAENVTYKQVVPYTDRMDYLAALCNNVAYSLAAEKLRPGGKVVLETVNPSSLYTYARAFWVDPDHVRPVHPNFLEFLFQEAKFARLSIEYRSPVSEAEALVPLPGDDPQTRLLNENFQRIGALLFGAQDYAVIATR